MNVLICSFPVNYSLGKVTWAQVTKWVPVETEVLVVAWVPKAIEAPVMAWDLVGIVVIDRGNAKPALRLDAPKAASFVKWTNKRRSSKRLLL